MLKDVDTCTGHESNNEALQCQSDIARGRQEQDHTPSKADEEDQGDQHLPNGNRHVVFILRLLGWLWKTWNYFERILIMCTKPSLKSKAELVEENNPQEGENLSVHLTQLMIMITQTSEKDRSRSSHKLTPRARRRGVMERCQDNCGRLGPRVRVARVLKQVPVQKLNVNLHFCLYRVPGLLALRRTTPSLALEKWFIAHVSSVNWTCLRASVLGAHIVMDSQACHCIKWRTSN